MDTRSYDWKEEANKYFAPSLTLAVILLLFSIVVFPSINVPETHIPLNWTPIEPLPPDKPDKIQPPDKLNMTIDLDGADISVKADPDETTRLLEEYLEKQRNANTPRLREVSSIVFEPYEDEPVPVKIVNPVYPEFARKIKLQGMVVLDVDVYKDGTVGKIRVLESLQSSPGGLDDAAMAAVKQWIFQPGKSGGKPVNTTVQIPIQFSLTH